MSKDTYSFGKCSGCGKHTALKNGYCSNCKPKKQSVYFGDLFDSLFSSYNPFK